MLNWNQPYASRRAPICGRNLVATSQPLAAAAGLDAMLRGGNAVDAALATAITLTVVEPNNNGLGSDAFAILWDGETLHAMNGSGRAPAGWLPERFRGRSEMPRLGWDAVTVPGAVSTWIALSERFGALDFGQLFQHAVRHARDGFPLGPITGQSLAWAAENYDGFDAFHAHFEPDGRALGPGEILRRPETAASLESIADSRGESFYRGELAEAMVTDASRHDGAMTMEDLAGHEATWVDTSTVNYRDVVLHEIPPNGQGLAAQIGLAVLNHFDAAGFGLNSLDLVHVQIEAMKVAVRASFDHFADPRAMRVSVEELLDPAGIAAVARSISLSRAAPLPPVALPVGHDTVYLTTADQSGMMVSFIQSNYMGFGSGIVVPGTGIAMQNRGYGFTLEDGHANQVGPGKRPFHTIIPGFVTLAGQPKMSFGVMGGHMQHQGHMQMVSRIFDFGENPQAASDAPRWHVTPDFEVVLEEGFSPEVARGLADRGHRVSFSSAAGLFGGAQLIYRMDDGYCAGSDHRKEGLAIGF